MTRVGDTDFLVDEQVDRFPFMEENEKVKNRGGEPADGTPLLFANFRHKQQDLVSRIERRGWWYAEGCRQR